MPREYLPTLTTLAKTPGPYSIAPLTPPLPPPAAEAQWIERFLGLMANREEFFCQPGPWAWSATPASATGNTSGPGITGDRRAIQAMSIPRGTAARSHGSEAV